VRKLLEDRHVFSELEMTRDNDAKNVEQSTVWVRFKETKHMKDWVNNDLRQRIATVRATMRGGKQVTKESISKEMGELITKAKVSLLDPISKLRVKIPVIGFNCKHGTQFFDLEWHFRNNLYRKGKSNKSWECPFCNIAAKRLVILDFWSKCLRDPKTQELEEVEILNNGTWQVPTRGQAICLSEDESPSKNVKRELLKKKKSLALRKELDSNKPIANEPEADKEKTIVDLSRIGSPSPEKELFSSLKTAKHSRSWSSSTDEQEERERKRKRRKKTYETSVLILDKEDFSDRKRQRSPSVDKLKKSRYLEPRSFKSFTKTSSTNKNINIFDISSMEPTEPSLTSYKLPKIPKLGPKEKPKRNPLVVAPGLAFGSPETCTPAVRADLKGGSMGLIRKQKTIEVETSLIDKALSSKQKSRDKLPEGKANSSNRFIQDENQPSSSKPAVVQPSKTVVMSKETFDHSKKVNETAKSVEPEKRKGNKKPRLGKTTLNKSQINSTVSPEPDGKKTNKKKLSPPSAGDSVIYPSAPEKVNIDSRVSKNNIIAEESVQNPMRVSEKFRGANPIPPRHDNVEAPAYEAVMFLLNNFPPEDSISDAICQWTAKIIQEEKIRLADRNPSDVNDGPRIKKRPGLTK